MHIKDLEVNVANVVMQTVLTHFTSVICTYFSSLHLSVRMKASFLITLTIISCVAASSGSGIFFFKDANLNSQGQEARAPPLSGGLKT